MNYQNRIIGLCHRSLPGKDRLAGQFARYFLTGGLAFAVDFGLFALFLYAFHLHYLLANGIGLVGGIIVNYLMSVVWVFSECSRTLEKQRGFEFFVFVVISVLGMLLNQLLMWLQVGIFEWPPLMAKMVAAALVLFWNFGARKGLLFRSKKESK